MYEYISKQRTKQWPVCASFVINDGQWQSGKGCSAPPTKWNSPLHGPYLKRIYFILGLNLSLTTTFQRLTLGK